MEGIGAHDCPAELEQLFNLLRMGLTGIALRRAIHVVYTY